MISVTTCFKNLSKPQCMDLILTNKLNLLQHRTVLETGLSNFHLLTVTEFKMDFEKQKTKITYRKCKTFDNEKFRSNILKHNFNESDFDSYKDTIFNLFSKDFSLKKKYVRPNEASFQTRNLHKEIMTRSSLRIFFLKDKTETNRES